MKIEIRIFKSILLKNSFLYKGETTTEKNLTSNQNNHESQQTEINILYFWQSVEIYLMYLS